VDTVAKHSNRGEMAFEAALLETEEQPMYQRIAEEAEHLHLMDLDELVEYVQPEQVDDDVCVKEP
jgi:hypothetical protein